MLILNRSFYTIFYVGPLGGIAGTVFGSRPVVIIGGVLASVGMMLGRFCNTVAELYVTWGLVVGTSNRFIDPSIENIPILLRCLLVRAGYGCICHVWGCFSSPPFPELAWPWKHFDRCCIDGPTSMFIKQVVLEPRVSPEHTWKYVDTVIFFAKTWTKGHLPLDDLWPHICWGLMCDSTQGSLCPSPMKIHQSMWIRWPFLQKLEAKVIDP